MAAAEDFTANGPASKMYKLKRHYESTGPVELPTCMYKLENIHQKKTEQSASEPADNAKLSVIEELEQRQEKILSQIEKLQRQVQDLMKDQNVTPVQQPAAAAPASRARPNTGRSMVPPALATPAAVIVAHPSKLLESCPRPRTTASTANKGDNINDLVISVSPSRLPLSLLVVQQMLAKQFRVLSSSFVHSSARSSTPPHLRDLYQNANNTAPSNRNAYQIAVSLVWKEEKYSPVLKVNPSQQTPVVGECNIARYLARLLSPAYDSGDPVTSTQIDGLIDLADAQLSNDGAQKANFVKVIGAQLGKSQWMLGENLTLADIVLWSAVHQLKQASRAPENIKRWLDACDQLPEFAFARQFV